MHKKIIFGLLGIILCIASLFFIFHNKKATHQIKWSKEPSAITVKDAWGTWNDFFREDIAPKTACTLKEFKELLKSVSYEKNETIDTLRSKKILNLKTRLEKYIDAKNPEDFYPEGDNLRGEKDFQSMIYHTQTDNEVSPVIIMEVHGSNNEIAYIKLDGVHRILAALLRKSKVRVLYIPIEIDEPVSIT